MIVETRTDPNTGETVIGKEIDELDDELTDESIMSRFGSSIAAANGNVTATINDIQEYLKESNIGNISHVSLATQYELVDLLNKSANDPDRIFKMRDLPDEIQTEIQKFFGKILAPLRLIVLLMSLIKNLINYIQRLRMKSFRCYKSMKRIEKKH